MKTHGLGLYLATLALTACQVKTPTASAPVPSPGVTSPGSDGERLTFARLVEDPPLSGPLTIGAQVSPDGSRVLYQKPRDGNSDILDLWQFNPTAGEHAELLRAEDLIDGEAELSGEEKARLERERISRVGITHYSFSPSGQEVLVPLAGQLFVMRFSDRNVTAIAGEGTKLDPRLSPDGHHVAFVQEANLHVVDLRTMKSKQLTRDGSETLINGLADFIAQEEMGRRQGYWWSPAGDQIAFIQYDESPVGVVERVTIGGDGATLTKQRYPAAGTPNVRARVGVVTLSGQTTWMNLGDNPDMYIARVSWTRDGGGLLVQRLERDQERLDLLRIDPATGESDVVLSETSQAWVNLHDDLKPMETGRFLWTSERSGFRHIYVYSADGASVTPITNGRWIVDQVHCVDESAGMVYFSGWLDDPTTRNLYRAPLDGSAASAPERITTRQGQHNVSAARDCSLYLDTFSSPTQPPQTSLHDGSGQRLAWLTENTLGPEHPYRPYLDSHSPPIFGVLDADEGTALHYKITRPHDFDPTRRYPAMLLVYGGPHVQRVQKSWNVQEQVWSDQGYVVFSLDNRGSSRRGHAFEAPLHRRLGDIEVRDQLTGLRFLQQQPYVDEDRIGVYGWSYGGYMSAMLLAKSNGEIAAGVLGAPVTDWRLYDTCYTERYLDHPDDNPEGYSQSSVLTVMDQIKVPLLLIHGMADDNVVLTHSTRFMQSLQRNHQAFDVMLYPGETHFFRDRGVRRHRDTTIGEFFERHLRP